MLNLPRPHGYGSAQVVQAWQNKLQREETEKDRGFRREQLEETRTGREATQGFRMKQLKATQETAAYNKMFKMLELGYKAIDDGNQEFGNTALEQAQKMSDSLGLGLNFSQTTDKAEALTALKNANIKKIQATIA